MTLITTDDLTPFATIDADKAAAMVEDAQAMAVLVAPCLGTEDTLTDAQKAAAKAILRGAILRWEDAGTGAFQSQTAGPFGVAYDTRVPQRRAMFWPSEIAQLQGICRGENDGGAYSVDTAPRALYGLQGHSLICSLILGGPGCSCGADLTAGQYPLYETSPDGA